VGTEVPSTQTSPQKFRDARNAISIRSWAARARRGGTEVSAPSLKKSCAPTHPRHEEQFIHYGLEGRAIWRHSMKKLRPFLCAARFVALGCVG